MQQTIRNKDDCTNLWEVKIWLWLLNNLDHNTDQGVQAARGDRNNALWQTHQEKGNTSWAQTIHGPIVLWDSFKASWNIQIFSWKLQSKISSHPFQLEHLTQEKESDKLMMHPHVGAGIPSVKQCMPSGHNRPARSLLQQQQGSSTSTPVSSTCKSHHLPSFVAPQYYRPRIRKSVKNKTSQSNSKKKERRCSWKLVQVETLYLKISSVCSRKYMTYVAPLCITPFKKLFGGSGE